MSKKVTTLDQIIAENFGVSQAESRRAIRLGGVKINGEVVKYNSLTNSDFLAGKEIKLGRNRTVVINKESN